MSVCEDNAKITKNAKNEEDGRKLNTFTNSRSGANKWLLVFNPNKCKVLWMGKRERKQVRIYSIKRRQEFVPQRDLGVHIIPSLRKDHTQTM